MKKYLVILNMGKDYKIPLEIKSETSADALYKASCLCISKGFFAVGMESIELDKEMGIIKVK